MKNIFVALLCALFISCETNKSNCSDYTQKECKEAKALSKKTCVLSNNICIDAENLAKNLEELEEINTKKNNSGFKDKYIFVDITSQGAKEALKVLKDLDNNNLSHKKCHFGVACFVNYSIAAASKADKIIILDYDPVVNRFNKIAREILITSSSPPEFKQKLIEASQRDEEIRQRNFYPETKDNNVNFENLERILGIDVSFLAHEENFKYIKKLAEDKKIFIFNGSIYDQELIKNITKLAKEEGCVFDTLFISNIYDWDQDSNKRLLLSENIKTLSNDNTKIIEVVPKKDKHYVNITYYKDPISKKSYDPLIMRDKKNISTKDAYPGAPLLVE